jgi:aldehyde dehydrogenase (NAD+)
MADWKFAPALAAGCCIVLKPSEVTPLTCIKLGSLIKEAGFPIGVFNIVPGYGPVAGEYLCRHKLVSKVSFTGSNIVGRLILKVNFIFHNKIF